MKKSLSVLLSAALAFGAFASVASAADSSLTTQQKFDELKAKGVFAGYADGQAHLDDNLQRAQAARIVALLLGAEGIGNPDTKVVTEKPFLDVDLGKWYTEEIAAVKELGAMSGNADGTFNPNGNLTNQEVAALLGQVLKLEPVEGAKVEGAADWAAGYIKALQDKGFTVPTPYTAAATRGALVEASFYADSVLNPAVPEKVSVTSAKATGVKKVSVTLDKAVDTSKATLTLKRNGSKVAATTNWADDKKSATLTLDSAKIIEGDYTVTLDGLGTEEVATATASFKGENEKVTKLEFTSPSDTLAQSDKVKVQFQALNQYGEETSLNAGNFTAYTSAPGGANVTKDANGNLFVVLDTNDPALIPNVSQISINIVNTDSQITVSKVFKLGSKPYVAKVELGDIVYSNGENYLSKSGDKAVIELVQYDQYGQRITTESGSLFNASASVVPFLNELGTPAIVDDNGDNELDVVVSLGGDAKVSGEYTVTVFGGSTASTKINVKATQYAASLELDTSVILAEGDSGVYIPLTAYDKDGNKLTNQDIVDNYESGHFQVSVSSNLTLENAASPTLATQGTQHAIVKAGEHKGQLYIKTVGAKGFANVFFNITPTSANGILFNKNYTLNIQDKRYPVSLKVVTDNAKKAIPDSANSATSTLKIQALDQYGESITRTIGDINESTRTVTYDVYVEVLSQVGGVSLSGISAGSHTALGDVLDKDLTFTAAAGAAVNDIYKVKISLRKRAWVSGAPGSVIDDSVSSVTKEMKVIDKASNLTYSVKDIDTLFNAIDDSAMDGAADSPTTSLHARTVEITAKDASGDTVALPSNYVVGVASSNYKVVDTDGLNKIIGNKAGTATITVTYKKANGGSATATKEVVVKDDAISVASMSADAQNLTVANNQKAAAVMNLEVKDNYNTKYTGNDIYTYDKLLGIRYSASDIQGSLTVDIDPDGTLHLTGTGSFTLTATAPNGKTAVTAVLVP